MTTTTPGLARSAVILAAGESRRMGRPKALIEIDGVALVTRHVARFAEAGCASMIIMTRPELVDAVETAIRDLPPARVVAARTASQSETLRLAAAYLATTGGDDAVTFITPVDVLPPSSDVLTRLADAIEAGADAATPRFDGRGGHPVALRATSLRAFASSALASLRDHLDALVHRRVRVDVDDPRVLGDLDHPRDVGQASHAAVSGS